MDEIQNIHIHVQMCIHTHAHLFKDIDKLASHKRFEDLREKRRGVQQGKPRI